jgi:hypothetical protein
VVISCSLLVGCPKYWHSELRVVQLPNLEGPLVDSLDLKI